MCIIVCVCVCVREREREGETERERGGICVFRNSQMQKANNYLFDYQVDP